MAATHIRKCSVWAVACHIEHQFLILEGTVVGLWVEAQCLHVAVAFCCVWLHTPYAHTFGKGTFD